MPTDCHDELAILRVRHDLDKRHKIVNVKSGPSLSQEEVMESIVHLLSTTQNDGGKDTCLLVSDYPHGTLTASLIPLIN